MLQSWQDSLHRGSPLGGVWKARLAHDASLSVCCPLHAFSLSKLLQESVSCLKEKAETVTAHRSRANSISFPVERMICNKSYANQAIFSDYCILMSKVTQYLKLLKTMHIIHVVQEINKMGVYVKQRTTREQLIKVVDGLDPALVQKHLAEMEAIPLKNQPKNYSPIKDTIPFVTSDIKRLVLDLAQVHQNYLNQYSQRFHKLKPPAQEPRDVINDLLGIRGEIFLDPKDIRHEYQNGSATLKSKIFPTYQQEKYIKKLKTITGVPSQWKKFVDVPTSQQRLLLSYGHRKENEFDLESHDILENWIYPDQLTTSQIKKSDILKLISNFHQKIDYYGVVIKSLTVPNILNIINAFKEELYASQLKPIILHNFFLTFSLFILQNPLFTKSIRYDNSYIRQTQQWIYASIRAFRSSLQYESLDLSLKDIFLQTLKRYSHIKKLLLKSSFANQVPEDVLLGTGQFQWPENTMSKIEQAVAEVSVAELPGRRVAEKLKNTKLVIEFAADQELEIPFSLFEKLIMSIRSGIEWMKSDREELQENKLLISELDFFYDMKLCSSVIKLLFVYGEVSIHLEQAIQFLWTRFFHLKALDQQTIQSMFLLANVTINYKYTQIFKKNDELIYELLAHSVETIYRQGFQALKKAEVINFLQQQAVLLLNDPHKQQLLNLIKEVSSKNTSN